MPGERRGGGLRERESETRPYTERTLTVTTKLDRSTRMAREQPQARFTALMGLLWEPEGLRESFVRQDGRKAPGVDGVRKADYAEGVQANLEELSARIRRLGYRAQPVRRAYIPKGDGRFRALGVPSFEDRLVQDRLSRILQAIWEPEFRNCSHGFRPGRGARDALRRVAEVITNERTQWVVEADIKGFFDHVSHTVQVWISWHQRGGGRYDGVVMHGLLLLIAEPRAGLRPGRIEPRQLKRRLKPFPLMTKSRCEAREEVRLNGHPKKQK